MLLRIFIAFLLLGGVALADDPTNSELFVAGGIMAVAEYFGHVTTHELVHSVAARYYGAKVIEFDILPTKDDSGQWHLGYMVYEYEYGTMDNDDHAVVAYAPTMFNLGFLAIFSASHELGLLPDNKYAKLSIAIAATFAAIDVLGEVFNTRESSDMTSAYDLLGYSNDQALGLRVIQGVLVGWVFFKIFEVLEEVFGPSTTSASDRIDYGKPYMSASRDQTRLGWSVPF